FTAPTLILKINCILDLTGAATLDGDPPEGTIEWHIDSVFLLPIDEGMVAVSGISASDRILIDDLSENPGVYVLDGSDVVHIVPNSRNLPAEVSETRYPIRIERLGLCVDSGGAGFRRGGLGSAGNLPAATLS
ncbi:MAG: hydantoinase B/oxoprolinase family protein, partial [Planctomycetes bacterium]|nr:hydantoinase B/oxoprolinase family protein [Planctomycetota bacterium]